MRVDYDAPRVVAALKIAPANVRRAFYERVRLLKGGTCIVLDVIPHPK